MRFYRALLYLYPVGFRAEYGEEMCGIFSERSRNATGAGAVMILWIETFIDTLLNAIGVHWDLLRQDLRYTVRTLTRAPGFAITVILVAALGIGATTAAFTVTDHVLVRPMPFADQHRLMKLWERTPGYSRMELSPANFRDWKAMSTSFETMAAYRGLSVNLVGQGDPERIEGASVTADLFPMLGIRPILGRLFVPEDDREGAAPTLLLSHRYWQASFGGDPGVLGTRVLLDGAPHIIIGVLPPDVHFPSREAALWTPMRFVAMDFEDRNNNYLHVIAKLERGTSAQQAREEMRVITAQLERAYPRENARTGATVTRLRDEVSGQTRLLLSALFGAALCLLLIACTNIANLLLARTLVRRKELAIRSSLGAGRERLVRQLLTETLILAILGGGFGVLMAHAVLPLLTTLVPQSLPIAEPSLDARVLIFAIFITGLAALGFGVLPALKACGEGAAADMREGPRSGVGSLKERLRSALVTAEVAASVVLLVSTGLLIRALWRLQATDPGFRTENVLTLRTSLSMPKYERTAQREQFYARALSEIRELPGVSHAAYISFLPMVLRGGIWPVSIGGHPRDRTESHTASLRFVTPGLFAALQIPLRHGRDVSDSDTGDSKFVAVVSESFVHRYWPGTDPLGRTFNFAFQERTVVGVVGEIRVRGLERSSEPQVYLPYKQVSDGALSWYAPKDLVIRSSTDARILIPAIRQIVRNIDPEQPISDVRMLDEIVKADTAPRNVQARVLATFALIAFLLAGVGIHGLLAFTVSSRAQEIGVRMALGAQPSDILALVLRASFLPAGAGMFLGATLGYVSGRGMEALLAGVTPADAATFLIAIGLSVAMTISGSALPALRAIRVNPTSVIRT